MPLQDTCLYYFSLGYDIHMGSYISVLCSLSNKNERNPKAPFPVPFVTIHFHYGGS